MMLYLIAATQGRELASQISDQFNHPRIQRHDDVQKMNPEDRFGIRNAKLGFVIRRMEASLNEPVDIKDLAESTSLSVRQLERLFLANLGKSPSKFYIERALLQNSRLRRDFPFRLWHQATGTISGVPRALKRFIRATRIWISAVWRSGSLALMRSPKALRSSR